jgi:hypothetical protein
MCLGRLSEVGTQSDDCEIGSYSGVCRGREREPPSDDDDDDDDKFPQCEKVRLKLIMSYATTFSVLVVGE